jgi:hypothetical protein
MGFLDYVDGLLNRVKRTEHVGQFYCRIPDEQVFKEDFTSQPLVKDRDYFEIRLSEMFLRDKREYWRGFVPLGVVLSDFIYDQERKTLPFLVGNQLLKGIGKSLEKEYVEYYNTRVVGPVPYMGDGLGLFVGLFRTQVTNLAANLFNFVETLVSAFDCGQLTPYLGIAQKLQGGLEKFLGWQEVEYRLGNRDEFIEGQRAPENPQAFRNGYLVYMNCPYDAVPPESLEVHQGRLSWKEGQELKRFRQYDYCLIKIERLPERGDLVVLPFYRLWEEVVDKIWDGDLTGASGKFNEFAQQMAKSAELTRAHRHHLIELFRTHFDEEIESFRHAKGEPALKAATTRGPAEILSPEASLQKTAKLVDKVGSPEEKAAVQGLKKLSRNLPGIPHLKERSQDFSWKYDPQNTEKAAAINNLINEQLKAVSQISQVEVPDPQALADAIMVASLNPRKKS